jgi:hypothetical protein
MLILGTVGEIKLTHFGNKYDNLLECVTARDMCIVLLSHVW